ncbi:uncharacterized protein METZ01_LOCUS332432, partial [marine metagenome]
KAFTSSAFPSPSCPRARQGFARKSQPPTHARIWNSPSPSSPKQRPRWAF